LSCQIACGSFTEIQILFLELYNSRADLKKKSLNPVISQAVNNNQAAAAAAAYLSSFFSPGHQTGIPEAEKLFW
jgi:hypothetical protein